MPGEVTYLLVDVGSTTTKVVAVGGEPPRVLARAAHPTTVEPPREDASIGVERAVEALGLGLPSPWAGRDHPRILFTSSAAGGLKILVAGLVRSITAESAQRASMGAGGVILDVLAVDDGRTDAQKVDLVGSLRPDLVLVAGGFEGSRGMQVLTLCEVLAMGADGETKTPLVFAGSTDLAEAVEDILSPYYRVMVVSNLRPGAREENFAPVTQAIQELFMEHVMAHAPGYERICSLASLGVIPTPFGVGQLVTLVAEKEGTAVLAIDIGGATTDVFSVSGGAMFRTVSANLGMSYSLGNTLVEAGIENFRRWMEPAPDERTLRNIVYQKVANPTRFPRTELEWQVDTAGAIEALRMALEQHLAMAWTLAPVTARGLFRSREAVLANAALTDRDKKRLSLLDVGLIIGSGGSLSFARTPRDTARILIEGLRPQGVTRLVLDTGSLVSHFGNLSRADPELALDLWRDNLTELATVVSPVGVCPRGRTALRWTQTDGGGRDGLAPGSGAGGEMLWLPLPVGREAELLFEPATGLDLGAGRGQPVKTRVTGSQVGLVVDLRGSGS